MRCESADSLLAMPSTCDESGLLFFSKNASSVLRSSTVKWCRLLFCRVFLPSSSSFAVLSCPVLSCSGVCTLPCCVCGRLLRLPLSWCSRRRLDGEGAISSNRGGDDPLDEWRDAARPLVVVWALSGGSARMDRGTLTGTPTGAQEGAATGMGMGTLTGAATAPASMPGSTCSTPGTSGAGCSTSTADVSMCSRDVSTGVTRKRYERVGQRLLSLHSLSSALTFSTKWKDFPLSVESSKR
mmetsp:Transcript_19013/g.48358  ORF Transcript_19013/g.48358 Transcript_19013/m.48358 type:complete len:240 (-) Transcript_19013:63-782(-)